MSDNERWGCWFPAAIGVITGLLIMIIGLLYLILEKL